MTPAAATAALSGGASSDRIVAWVAAVLAPRLPPAATLVDVGCGQGALADALRGRLQRSLGLDVVAYPGLSGRPELAFHLADLNAPPFPLPAAIADAAVAVETIEHLENPRALMRELVRLARPGGLVLVTTPNQLSWLSKVSLVCKHEFTAFQEGPGLYPTHITALLPTDLLRIARECGLRDCELRYSLHGRLPGSARLYPAWLSRRCPRGASDNVMLVGRTPA
ncbi:MAG TPA: methyltransferase domain-containing protein [Terriglobales bacterium]|nr:methyltransferase domain-containing protein [Terriglobales bacterium]